MEKLAMNEERAKTAIEEMGQYAMWIKPSISITLDGHYTATELEALVWWMNCKEMICMTAAYNEK